MLSAIVLAAGKSRRFAAKFSKVISKIGPYPAVYYSLFTLNRHPDIDEIIVVACPENIKEISALVRRYKIDKAGKIVLGGRERRDSVFKGLKSLGPGVDYVLIHDAARPFINRDMVSSVVLAAKRSGAAVTGVLAKDTIKEVTGFIVRKTLKREGLWVIQTPQVFRKALVLKAYEKFSRVKATDDAMLVEKLGAKVSVVKGSYSNIKITTPEDLVIAKAILGKKLW